MSLGENYTQCFATHHYNLRNTRSTPIHSTKYNKAHCKTKRKKTSYENSKEEKKKTMNRNHFSFIWICKQKTMKQRQKHTESKCSMHVSYHKMRTRSWNASMHCISRLLWSFVFFRFHWRMWVNAITRVKELARFLFTLCVRFELMGSIDWSKCSFFH